MNIRKKILTRCGALLTAVLVLAPTALAAEAEIPYIPQTVPAAQLAPADQRGQEDWQLLLVNPWHTVPEGYEIKLATLSNGLQVDERIYDDLDDMLSDCREAGLNPIVCSAYRTEATQTRLYRNKVARVRASGVPEDRVEAEAARWVAKPGTSEHQTGLALLHKAGLTVGVFGYGYQAGGIHIQPVHKAYFVILAAVYHVFHNAVGQSMGDVSLGRVDDHARLFVNDQQTVILVDNSDGNVLWGKVAGFLGEPDGNHVSGLYRQPAICLFAIEINQLVPLDLGPHAGGKIEFAAQYAFDIQDVFIFFSKNISELVHVSPNYYKNLVLTLSQKS